MDHHAVSWEQAFSKNLSRHHRGKDINFLEMHTVLLVIQHWLPLFRHHRLVIFTDNTTVFHGLSHRSVRGPAMDPLRRITLCAALQDIDICPQWIPTHENTLADLLSRRDFNKLADLFPLLAQVWRQISVKTPRTTRSHLVVVHLVWFPNTMCIAVGFPNLMHDHEVRPRLRANFRQNTPYHEVALRGRPSGLVS